LTDGGRVGVEQSPGENGKKEKKVEVAKEGLLCG
jgi:hypothetical protein